MFIIPEESEDICFSFVFNVKRFGVVTSRNPIGRIRPGSREPHPPLRVAFTNTSRKKPRLALKTH